jgi:hypothetical protein
MGDAGAASLTTGMPPADLVLPERGRAVEAGESAPAQNQEHRDAAPAARSQLKRLPALGSVDGTPLFTEPGF